VDSRSSTALQASGSARVTAGAIRVVGGVQRTGNATLSPAPVTGVTAVTDPMAGLAAYTGGTNQGSINISGTTSRTINRGISSSITVSGSARLTLNAGVYAISGGGFNVSGNGIVTGTGVMIYNAGSNYPGAGGTFGAINISGNASLTLTAATTGAYAGV